MLSILVDKNLRNNSTYILMVNLAISDFIDAIFVNSFTAVGKIFGFF